MASEDDRAVQEALKSGEWKEVKDEKTGRVYYFNPSTKETSWDLKKRLAKGGKDSKGSSARSSPVRSAPSPVDMKVRRAAGGDEPKASEWSERVDPKTGKTYYYNAATRETTWTKPEVMGGAARDPSPGRESPKGAEGHTPSAEWEEKTDPKTGRHYFYNPKTRETNWSKPGSSTPPAGPAVPARQPTPSKAPEGRPGAASPRTAAVEVALKDPARKDADSLQKLLSENNSLRHLVASGSQGQVALDLQSKCDALSKTNSALTVQIERLTQEHESMSNALVDANKRIQELESLHLEVQLLSVATEGTKDDEIKKTISHLREQNRVLVTQLAELSMLLARGLNEQAFNTADLRSAKPPVGKLSAADVVARFMECEAKNDLCQKCVLALSKYREAPRQSNIGRVPLVTFSGREELGGSNPVYHPIPDLVASSPEQAAAPPPQRGLGTPYGIAPTPAAIYTSSTPDQPATRNVMYGGFVVKMRPTG